MIPGVPMFKGEKHFVDGEVCWFDAGKSMTLEHKKSGRSGGEIFENIFVTKHHANGKFLPSCQSNE